MKGKLRLSLSIGCLVLIALLPKVIRADAITFAFTAGNGTALAANVGGLSTTASSLKLLNVTDSASSTIDLLSLTDATVSISTGVSSSYSAVGLVLHADYLPGASSVIEVKLTSDSCTTGTGSMTDVCLLGTENTDQYSATKGSTGSFEGVFHQTYLDPVIFAVFHASGLAGSGSDALTTSFNTFNGPPVTADSATLAGGDITIQTSRPLIGFVPEPDTFLLLGSGLLGLASMLRFKLSQKS